MSMYPVQSVQYYIIRIPSPHVQYFLYHTHPMSSCPVLLIPYVFNFLMSNTIPYVYNVLMSRTLSYVSNVPPVSSIQYFQYSKTTNFQI
ncbi:hypothetical protein CEXT_373821 [Caerostris extrusa]|uniref:Uncharacterized protein n=1 Tax=Caerostris extrusa TaxID=172846 RepID=A0AAV4YGB9_CAEEX|nr:hypothetical protein CEXT_373821 [Caerostris extrusa]